MITMTLDWGALIAFIGWSLFVFWLGRRSAGPRDRDLSGPPPSFAMPRPAPSAALSPEAIAAIRGELARGNKINAIKLMREATGMGLAESKQAVEAMEN